MISCTCELTIPYTVLEEDTSAPSSSISVVSEKRDDHSLQVMPANAQPRTACKHSLQQPNKVASVQETSSCVQGLYAIRSEIINALYHYQT